MLNTQERFVLMTQRIVKKGTLEGAYFLYSGKFKFAVFDCGL